MSHNKLTTILHPIMSRTPIMTNRDIMPKIVRDFETHCTTYFINAKDGVADNMKVTKILGCFENNLIADWTSMEQERLAKLTFKEFMKEFCKRWLPDNWEQIIRVEMLGTHLDPKLHHFETWAAQIMLHNISLRNTPSFLTDEQLHSQLDIMLDAELQTLAQSQSVSDIKDLHKWMTKIKKIDNECQIHLKQMAEFFNESIQASKRQFTSQYQTTSNVDTQYRAPRTSGSFPATCLAARNPNASSTVASSAPHPPRLTEEEHHLLHNHEGCLKCHEFYIGHHANTCTVTLTGNGYRTRTLQDTLRAKAAHGNPCPAPPPPVAATVETVHAPKPTELVVAVFPQNAHITVDTSMADDSDLSIASVSDGPPLKGKHFIWTCWVDNPTDHVSVKARTLIDGGAHMVLIRPDLVTHLNLSVKPLEKPEQVNVALGSTEHINQLTHYVTITPMSLDNCFHLQPLHAVIAPGLCMPLILGLPFLCTNRITCNYAKHTCLITTMIPPYNLLNVPPKVMKTLVLKTMLPDILASLKECTMTTSIDDELAMHDLELWKEFCCIFEPPPHVNKLPEEPVTQIKLKDQSHCIKMRNYPCPRKWKEAWHTLLQQHLEAGWIRLSLAPAGSGAFIIPKADPNVLPR